MFYTIYKTTNLLDGKYYIGKHQTKDPNDDYVGSGKHLWHAINKYGIENFKKEILFIFDNEVEMNEKEAELVCENFVKEDTNYNLCPGGQGGFGHIRSQKEYLEWVKSGRSAADIAIREKYGVENISQLPENRERARLAMIERHESSVVVNGMLGKKHSEETREKMSGPRGKYNVNKVGIPRGPYKKKNNG